MSFLSPSEQSARTRREIMENGSSVERADIERLERQVAVLNNEVLEDPNFPVRERQGINNLIRNSDHNHSVDTWFNSVPAGDNQLHECANVYAYPELAPVIVTDAAMTAGNNTIDCTTSAPFTSAMNGRWAVIEGAGASGARLAGTLTYVSPTQATLSVNASTNVSGARARLNLQKLGHKTTKNNVGAVNDALKSSTHTDYNSNITDPDWNKSSGYFRLGGAQIVGYPFGRFASNGTTYVPLHFTFSGRELFARFNISRMNAFVKVKGRLFMGVYNNHEEVLDFVAGSNLSISGQVIGNPSSTISTEYMIVLETEQGFSIVSNVLTVAGAPDDTGFNQGARVRLSWTYYAGATRVVVYRKRAGGNVFRLEADDNPRGSYVDVNNATREDTGSTSFPSIPDSVENVRSYWASPEGEFDDLAIDGSGVSWRPLEVRLPYPPSVDMSKLFDPHFIIGLTQPLATEVTDAATNGTATVTSAAAQFTAAMVGKNFTITNPATLQTHTGTVAAYVGPGEITLSSAVPWSAAGNILEIEDSQPHGLHIDCVGVSINDGEWEINPEDNSELRGQPVASNPNGSTQGSPTGGAPTGGGGTGGIDCVSDAAMIKVLGRVGLLRFLFVQALVYLRISFPDRWKVRIAEKPAGEVHLTDRLWNGLGYSDADFNELAWIRRAEVGELRLLETETKKLGCTESHRLVRGRQDFRNGIMTRRLKTGEKVLISDGKGVRIETVLAMPAIKGRFTVISFGMKKSKKRTGRLFVADDVLGHNRKYRDYELPETQF